MCERWSNKFKGSYGIRLKQSVLVVLVLNDLQFITVTVDTGRRRLLCNISQYTVKCSVCVACPAPSYAVGSSLQSGVLTMLRGASTSRMIHSEMEEWMARQ